MRLIIDKVVLEHCHARVNSTALIEHGGCCLNGLL